MSDSALVLHENAAISAYQDREDVRELGERLMAMHPAAAEVGASAMRAAAQLALLLGANPLPGVNEVHIWKDNKGRNCMSLGINYWRRKSREWGGVLFEVQPRPMRANEMADYGVAPGTIAAICKGVRADDMIRFKQMGFTTNEVWTMCGATGIGTQGPNEYAKSGRPNVWTSLKRAETDMLRQLFPAEFGQTEQQIITSDAPTMPIVDGEIIEEDETTYTLEDANNDLFGPMPGDIQRDNVAEVVTEPPPSNALQYADGSFVPDNPQTREVYHAYIAAHDGKAPDNKFNLKAWNDKQKAAVVEAPTLPLDPPAPVGNGAYEE